MNEVCAIFRDALCVPLPGVSTLGEGVETQEQLERLIALGCDAAQGYLLGRPLTPEAADRIITLQSVAADTGATRTQFLATGT